jgi:glycosyltransferase involved in cell wall biosynthesis
LNVFHIQKATGVGGSERHLLSLLAGLERRGVHIRMCVLAAGDFRRFTGKLKAAGLDTIVVRAGLDLNPFLIPNLAREIKAFRPDAVHTHLIHADVYGQAAARLARVPGVSSMHSTHSFYRRQPWRTAARVAGHMVRSQIAISEHVLRFIRDLRLSPADRVRMIHYGIDAAEWRPSPQSRSAARAELEISPQDVAVGLASRLVPFKGHDFVLDGFASAIEYVPNLRLLVAGDGPLRADLEAEARGRFSNGTVRFLGYIERMYQFMSACDVFVVPTHPRLSEGFGLAALEAMASGLPVVATAVGSLPEVVRDGETGVIVDPGDVSQLAAAFRMLACDDEARIRMGQLARDRAQTTFGLESMVDGVISVYEDVLSSK